VPGVAPSPPCGSRAPQIVSTRISTSSVCGLRHPEAVSDIALPCDSNVRGAAVHGRSGNWQWRPSAVLPGAPENLASAYLRMAGFQRWVWISLWLGPATRSRTWPPASWRVNILVGILGPPVREKSLTHSGAAAAGVAVSCSATAGSRATWSSPSAIRISRVQRRMWTCRICPMRRGTHVC